MAKTTTITREYDREGRVVKETIVESGEANALDGPAVAPVWISPLPHRYAGDIRPSSAWPTYTVNN